MGLEKLMDEALRLKPHERLALVDGLLKSLDEPDKTIDEIWVEEAEKRLIAYREGKIDAIPIEEIFGSE